MDEGKGRDSRSEELLFDDFEVVGGRHQKRSSTCIVAKLRIRSTVEKKLYQPLIA